MANKNVDTMDAETMDAETMDAETTTTEASRESGAETSIGLDQNIATAVSYVFGFLSGLVVFLVEKENDHVRFHAAQSMVVFAGFVAISIALTVLGILMGAVLPGLADLLVGLVISLASLGVSVGAFVAWIYLVVRSYQGANPRIPVAAGIADSLAK